MSSRASNHCNHKTLASPPRDTHELLFFEGFKEAGGGGASRECRAAACSVCRALNSLSFKHWSGSLSSNNATNAAWPIGLLGNPHVLSPLVLRAHRTLRCAVAYGEAHRIKCVYCA